MRKTCLVVLVVAAVAGLIKIVGAVTMNPASNALADSANTALTIILRDASGNFSAGTITAALVGNVTGSLSGTSNTVVASTFSVNALNAVASGSCSGYKIGFASDGLYLCNNSAWQKAVAGATQITWTTY